MSFLTMSSSFTRDSSISRFFICFYSPQLGEFCVYCILMFTFLLLWSISKSRNKILGNKNGSQKNKIVRILPLALGELKEID